MLNKVILMGRLTKKPILEATPSGVSVTKFTLAVDRNYVKQGEERYADFISCVAWRGTAEFINKYFDKGQLMALVGSVQTRTWDDDEGKRHYVTEVVADEVSFAGGKVNTPTEAEKKEDKPDFEETDDDKDLPF